MNYKGKRVSLLTLGEELLKCDWVEYQASERQDVVSLLAYTASLLQQQVKLLTDIADEVVPERRKEVESRKQWDEKYDLVQSQIERIVKHKKEIAKRTAVARWPHLSKDRQQWLAEKIASARCVPMLVSFDNLNGNYITASEEQIESHLAAFEAWASSFTSVDGCGFMPMTIKKIHAIISRQDQTSC